MTNQLQLNKLLWGVCIYLFLFVSSTLQAQNALDFDGIDDFVDCGNNTSLNLTGNSLTLEAWIYPTSFKSLFWQGNVVNKNDINVNGYMLRVGGNGEVNFNIGNGAWNEITSPVNAVTLNTWHHIAGVYDGASMLLYVDGALVATGALTGNVGSASQPLYLGEDPQFRGRYFPGRIDEVRIWSDARTASEISLYRNSEFCDSTNLVAWYQFDQGVANGTNTIVTNLTDNNGVNTGTLNNFGLTSTTSNWTNGQQISSNRSIDNQIACSAFTWRNGVSYTTSNNTALDTIQGGAINGCDSIIRLNLTFGAAVTSIDVQTACGPYTWIDGNTYTASTNTVSDTLIGASVNGCDSIVFLDLTISPFVSSIDTVLSFGPYTWIDGNTYRMSNNTAADTLFGVGVNGCDSVVFLDLTVLISGDENALDFDGIDDYVDCGTDPSLDITGNSITIEAWVYPTSFKPLFWQGNVVNKVDATNDNGYMIRVGGNGEVNFNIGDGSWNEITSPINTVSLNTWHHIAATYDGVNMRIYVDGTVVATGAFSSNVGSTSLSLFLGEDPRFRGRYFPGRIEEVRIWDDARTSNEINLYMNSEFCDSTNLVAWYQFNEGIRSLNNNGLTALNDLAGANNGTLMNFALNTSVSNWVEGVDISNNRSTDIQVVCGNSYRWIDGNTYTSSTNSAMLVLPGAAANGCDSSVVLDLTLNSIDTSIIRSGVVLVSNEPGATYQWLDCANGYAILAGQTAQSISMMNGRSYAVEITKNNCTDTSSCFTNIGVGLDENTIDDRRNFSMYPNPTKNHLLIEVTDPSNLKLDLRIYNLEGRVVYESLLLTKIHRINLNGLANGVYVVNYGNQYQKLVIQ